MINYISMKLLIKDEGLAKRVRNTTGEEVNTNIFFTHTLKGVFGLNSIGGQQKKMKHRKIIYSKLQITGASIPLQRQAIFAGPESPYNRRYRAKQNHPE